ncbi:MAG TPA: class II aldolase/adducin family protein [Gaiellaceae bacterium]|nr:class II aldolase/adducin family protein [Gaiellaceae bacterium]
MPKSSDLSAARPSSRAAEAEATASFAVVGRPATASLDRLVGLLRDALGQAGLSETADANAADLVINVVDVDDPKPFRRRSRGTFVVGLYERESHSLPEDYPMLVRALANIALCYVPGEGAWFTTMERGHYGDTAERGEEALAAAIVDRLLPLARSRLVIDNEFVTDLEPALWDGDEVTEEIIAAGARLGDLDLLPSPFPIEDLLSERELRHVKRLYGIGGLSYGNLSQRKDERRFWMSASGVDKSKLEQPGRDILLVSNYDQEHNRIVLSVPPGIEPRRVSVDAIEHWMIYQAHPGVGAILHVHAWMQEIPATDVNYPCGTEELARSVAELLAAEPNPNEAVIGLRNHGITVTGPSLMAILDRIEPRILRQVPMM